MINLDLTSEERKIHEDDDWIMFGTKGNDGIEPADGPELIGNASADGGDILCGLEGNDKLRPNAGDDHVYGGSGSDDLAGQDGDDWIHGDDEDTFIGGGHGASGESEGTPDATNYCEPVPAEGFIDVNQACTKPPD
jgi:Ca2+-binding RTX toxin-like protein